MDYGTITDHILDMSKFYYYTFIRSNDGKWQYAAEDSCWKGIIYKEILQQEVENQLEKIYQDLINND